MPSRHFVEKLLVRLKSGDARSIHLNALPGNFARLDVYDLANIEPSLQLKFLYELLSKKSFRFSITIDPSLLNTKANDEASTEKKKILQKIIKRLNHLDYQEKQEFAEHGYHSFAFGYPLLIKRDPNNAGRILKAPLLIWYMDIEKDHRRNNTWTISRNEDHPLIFNELLQSHLESVEEINANDLNDLLEDDFIDEAQLNIFCKALLEKLNIPFDEKENIATILPSTNKETIEQVSGEVPWIRWSGVFGLYKMQKQSIIKDMENLLQNEIASDIESDDAIYFDGEVLTPIMLDPSQENVLQQLKQTNRVVIQGPPGTGKSQSLTAIIAQALLNKKKVLVVCEKRTAMEVLYENLKKENLHHLCALIEDVYADRKNIVEHVRNLSEQLPAAIRFRNNEYEAVRSKFLSLQEEINHRINFTVKEVFGDDNWLELLSRSLELNANQEIFDLSNAINKSVRTSLFEFNYDESISLAEKIRIAKELFFKVDKDAFVFDDMNSSIYIPGLEAQKLFEDINALHDHSKYIEEKIKSNIAQYGDHYNLLGGFPKFITNVLSFVLSRYKNIRTQKEETITAYEQLKSSVLSQNYFPLSFTETTTLIKMDELLYSVQSVKDKSARFLSHRHLFENYFRYKNFFESQDEKTKAVINALIVLQSEVWENIFQTWYINQTVLKTAIQNGIKTDTPKLYEELMQADQQLKQKLSEKINFLWQEEIQQAIQSKDPAELKYLYNQRKNKQYTSKNPLRKIIHEDFNFFTTLFPVLMVNPAAASSILPFGELFDLIILDEASQLRLEDTYSSLLRAKTKIISGDKHQMPPSSFFTSDVVFWNEEEENEAEIFLAESKSLLEFADDANYKNTYLDFHYRSMHPDLIGFSNHAFYQSRLIPMPAKEDYKPLHYIHVEGLYKEGINADEAREIVRFIFSQEKVNGEYPSIGIATFNIYQRDMIYDELYGQAYADKEKSDTLQELINRGLFVKNLENIQGDERDIMILSTTFGRDENGKFRQAFGPLTQEKGYQLLNVIITRAKHSLYVFTSIPENIFLNFDEELSQKGNTGKSIFYAYLAYVKAVAEKDEHQKEFIQNRLQKNTASQYATNSFYSFSFKDLVYEALEKEFGENIQRDYKFGGFTLDMVFLKNNQPVLQINFEHVQNYHPEVSYRIKIHQQQMVKAHGIDTYHLWSYNWWMNAHSALEEIAAIVKDF